MSFFKRLKRGRAANSLIVEMLYGQALKEIESGQRRDGLWAKALANSSDDEKKARSLYIEYRVQSMIDEEDVAEGVLEEATEHVREEERRDDLLLKNSILQYDEWLEKYHATDRGNWNYYEPQYHREYSKYLLGVRRTQKWGRSVIPQPDE
jgi:hypothetical protein